MGSPDEGNFLRAPLHGMDVGNTAVLPEQW